MGDSSSGLGGLVLVAVVAGGLAWNKISDLTKERDDLQEQVEQLQSHLSDVQEKSAALEASSDALKEQVERFSSENWRDVVPDAEEATEQVSSDSDDLKEATDDQ